MAGEGPKFGGEGLSCGGERPPSQEHLRFFGPPSDDGGHTLHTIR